MIVRKLNVEDLPAYERVQAVCFTFSSDMEARDKRGYQLSDRDDVWGSFTDEGVLQGGMIASHYLMRVGARQFKGAGIGGVTTLPEYRRTGAIRAIFREMFKDLKAQGFVLSGLYPFSHAFYRKFGYEIGHTFDHYIVPTSELLGNLQPKAVYMAVGDERLDEVMAVYEAFSKTRTLSIARPDKESWKALWSGEPYQSRCYRYLLYNDENAPCAYVNFTVDDKREARRAVIRELAFIDKASFYLALGFLSRFHPHYAEVDLFLPSDVFFTGLHANPYEVKPQPGHEYMMRILDVPAFLSGMDCPEGCGSLTLQVTDEFLPENAGTYTLSWEDGRLSCERTERPADLKLDQTSLTQLAMGFMPIARLKYRRDVELHCGEALVNAVFPERPRYVGDRY